MDTSAVARHDRVVDDDAVTFRTIDLARDLALCVAFRRDSYVCSFGTADEHMSADGADYRAWLRKRHADEPDGHVHLWRGEQIVGQLEMRVKSLDPPRGHVNLFYLVPEERGRGLAAVLVEYVTEFFRTRGVAQVILNVSPTNARALAFYRKHGWRPVNPEPNERGVLTMQLDLDAR